MNLPGQTTELQRSFFGNTPDAARDAASAWLRDFDAHEPFEILSINTLEYGSLFVTTVIYSETGIKPRAPSKEAPVSQEATPSARARCSQVESQLRLRSNTVVDRLGPLLTPALAPSWSKAPESADVFESMFDDAFLWAPLGGRKDMAAVASAAGSEL
jgi:hypothetical protein